MRTPKNCHRPNVIAMSIRMDTRCERVNDGWKAKLSLLPAAPRDAENCCLTWHVISWHHCSAGLKSATWRWISQLCGFLKANIFFLNSDLNLTCHPLENCPWWCICSECIHLRGYQQRNRVWQDLFESICVLLFLGDSKERNIANIWHPNIIFLVGLLQEQVRVYSGLQLWVYDGLGSEDLCPAHL